MEHSRRGEDYVPLSRPLPPVGRREQPLTPAALVPEVSGEALSGWQASELPPLPGYLTLKIDFNALGQAAPWIYPIMRHAMSPV
jgi:hypothetical protein